MNTKNNASIINPSFYFIKLPYIFRLERAKLQHLLTHIILCVII